ncbi:MAG: cbb3-type cytochrome c oxidase N-terminal domain-containing protein [Planctomycetota bacterium]
MSEQQDGQAREDQLTGHNYDGIQEYDNPTPGWWTWLFILSVIFAIPYMIFTLISDGALTPEGQFERAKVANMAKKFGTIGELEPDAATILEYSKDPEWVAFGQNVYLSNCKQCHGNNAEGNASAPNLTDDAFIHVNTVEDIADVVINGRGGGKMPAWGNRLHPNEVVLVSSYIASIRGTNAPGGMAPEGEVPPPWEGGEDAASAND